MISSHHPIHIHKAWHERVPHACWPMALYQNHRAPGLSVLTLTWTEVLLATSEPTTPQLMGLLLMALLLFGTHVSTEALGTAVLLIIPKRQHHTRDHNPRQGGGRGAIQTDPVNNSPSSAQHKNKQATELD